ncbi:slyX family protein [Piscirickettsia salmonis]|uniref:Uncharacterized protein n=1 Tax=Piscirickettsia salmonis TaxID=1238 RepID=A0A9Q5YKZ0_PISSA|nr:SlyX family protein [Piscirickettsia salmonis]RNC78901.1 slyX family protein [Piscirickettsiaceae bacterium NZ-RLO2]ALA24518.1 slyX family protein [Piscirickettsia salmonis]APS44872.1 slyX family protein [Piscirickettsia salmonis]APS48233.1 slyX family protein [Piscirickettsia salmonis]APS49499.1 slyX family protein [Piscirickettsia salmonis]
MSLDERLVELETKFVFQEDMINQLNQVIIQQQAQLEQLTQALMQLKTKLAAQDVDHASMIDPAYERPPHY